MLIPIRFTVTVLSAAEVIKLVWNRWIAVGVFRACCQCSGMPGARCSLDRLFQLADLRHQLANQKSADPEQWRGKI